MVRTSDNQVRLAPADWCGLGSIALAVFTLLGATHYKLHEIAQSNRQRLAAVEADVTGVKRSVTLLQADVRVIARRARP